MGSARASKPLQLCRCAPTLTAHAVPHLHLPPQFQAASVVTALVLSFSEGPSPLPFPLFLAAVSLRGQCCLMTAKVVTSTKWSDSCSRAPAFWAACMHPSATPRCRCWLSRLCLAAATCGWLLLGRCGRWTRTGSSSRRLCCQVRWGTRVCGGGGVCLILGECVSTLLPPCAAGCCWCTAICGP